MSYMSFMMMGFHNIIWVFVGAQFIGAPPIDRPWAGHATEPVYFM